ncbi:DUF6177 family protein [Streptomyces sp. NPDC007991]|uniref:DUF6177 family protein n=1 Tax=Streptomyces sp. NPDC007991 TaxID=3364803 RepID=UPI0036EA3466
MARQSQSTRRDLTVPSHLELPPIPVTFTLGHDEIERIGPAHAAHPPQGPTPARLGPAAQSALHYCLGDGTDARARTTFQRLVRHLKQT